jgi:hypothetical protein
MMIVLLLPGNATVEPRCSAARTGRGAEMSAIEVRTASQFKKNVLDSDVPVLVFFSAPW